MGGQRSHSSNMPGAHINRTNGQGSYIGLFLEETDKEENSRLVSTTDHRRYLDRRALCPENWPKDVEAIQWHGQTVSRFPWDVKVS